MTTEALPPGDVVCRLCGWTGPVDVMEWHPCAGAVQADPLKRSPRRR